MFWKHDFVCVVLFFMCMYDDDQSHTICVCGLDIESYIEELKMHFCSSVVRFNCQRLWFFEKKISIKAEMVVIGQYRTIKILTSKKNRLKKPANLFLKKA